MERNSLGGTCLADRHCGALLSCHFGAESAEAVGKVENMLSSYTYSVLAVDGVCELSMWAVGQLILRSPSFREEEKRKFFLLLLSEYKKKKNILKLPKSGE